MLYLVVGAWFSRSRDAQRRPCRLEARPLASATAWLEDYRSFWEERYQKLDVLLDELQAGGDVQGASS